MNECCPPRCRGFCTRGPYSGKITGSSDIQVNFDPSCCTGTLPDANTILWSNDTFWTRQP